MLGNIRQLLVFVEREKCDRTFWEHSQQGSSIPILINMEEKRVRSNFSDTGSKNSDNFKASKTPKGFFEGCRIYYSYYWREAEILRTPGLSVTKLLEF